MCYSFPPQTMIMQSHYLRLANQAFAQNDKELAKSLLLVAKRKGLSQVDRIAYKELLQRNSITPGDITLQNTLPIDSKTTKFLDDMLLAVNKTKGGGDCGFYALLFGLVQSGHWAQDIKEHKALHQYIKGELNIAAQGYDLRLMSRQKATEIISGDKNANLMFKNGALLGSVGPDGEIEIWKCNKKGTGWQKHNLEPANLTLGNLPGIKLNEPARNSLKKGNGDIKIFAENRKFKEFIRKNVGDIPKKYAREMVKERLEELKNDGLIKKEEDILKRNGLGKLCKVYIEVKENGRKISFNEREYIANEFYDNMQKLNPSDINDSSFSKDCILAIRKLTAKTYTESIVKSISQYGSINGYIRFYEKDDQGFLKEMGSFFSRRNPFRQSNDMEYIVSQKVRKQMGGNVHLNFDATDVGIDGAKPISELVASIYGNFQKKGGIAKYIKSGYSWRRNIRNMNTADDLIAKGIEEDAKLKNEDISSYTDDEIKQKIQEKLISQRNKFKDLVEKELENQLYTQVRKHPISTALYNHHRWSDRESIQSLENTFNCTIDYKDCQAETDAQNNYSMRQNLRKAVLLDLYRKGKLEIKDERGGNGTRIYRNNSDNNEANYKITLTALVDNDDPEFKVMTEEEFQAAKDDSKIEWKTVYLVKDKQGKFSLKMMNPKYEIVEEKLEKINDGIIGGIESCLNGKNEEVGTIYSVIKEECSKEIASLRSQCSKKVRVTFEHSGKQETVEVDEGMEQPFADNNSNAKEQNKWVEQLLVCDGVKHAVNDLGYDFKSIDSLGNNNDNVKENTLYIRLKKPWLGKNRIEYVVKTPEGKVIRDQINLKDIERKKPIDIANLYSKNSKTDILHALEKRGHVNTTKSFSTSLDNEYRENGEGSNHIMMKNSEKGLFFKVRHFESITTPHAMRRASKKNSSANSCANHDHDGALDIDRKLHHKNEIQSKQQLDKNSFHGASNKRRMKYGLENDQSKQKALDENKDTGQNHQEQLHKTTMC